MKSYFDYDRIPAGYYDHVISNGHAIQRAWHRQKFERVKAVVGLESGESLLDIGCGPGTFLGMFEDSEVNLVGVDTSLKQCQYAKEKYGTKRRSFHHLRENGVLPFSDSSYDKITIIELIEHLHPGEIQMLFREIRRVLKPSGKVVLTTPNYLSHWPILEALVGMLSPVAYHEQHVTRFSFPTVRRHIRKLLGNEISVIQVTTILFLSPFLAVISTRLAGSLAKAFPPKSWHWPLGALIIASLTWDPRIRTKQ